MKGDYRVKEHDNQFDVERRIDLYLNGRLDQGQIDALWVDMIENPVYFSYLKTSASLRSLLGNQKIAYTSQAVKKAPELLNPGKVKFMSSSWARYAAAAAVILISGVTAMYYQNAASGPDVLQRLVSLELVVYRSADTAGLTAPDVELKEAVDMALAGNTTSAILLLNSIIEQSVEAEIQAEALLNIGIIEYNSDDFDAAVVSLQRASAYTGIDKLLYERIMWNLSHAQMAVGNQHAARESIETVISLDGAHSRRAKDYLKYLK